MTSSAQDRFIGDDTRMLHRTTLHEENKKYVLWNADVGPIAEVLHERNCFPTQSFTEIGQSVVELCPKTLLFGSPPSILNFNFFSIFGQVTVIELHICSSVHISPKADDFSLRYGDLTIFKITVIRHLEF